MNLNLRVYRVGDEVLYWQSHHRGEMSTGTVICVVDLPGYSFPHYIIETPTHVDPVLSIRAGSWPEMRPKPCALTCVVWA